MYDMVDRHPFKALSTSGLPRSTMFPRGDNLPCHLIEMQYLYINAFSIERIIQEVEGGVELVVQYPARGSTQVLLCLFHGVLWL